MLWCPQTLSWLGQSREDKMSSMRSSFGFGLKCLGNTPVLSLPYQEVSAFTSIKFSEMFLKEPGFSQTKYLQLLVAFSCSSAHKILSVWHVCKIFKSHEHELQPNNSFYGLLVCLCSSVCVSLTLYDRAASRVSLWVIDRHAAVSICFSVTASPPCQKANTYIHWLIWPTFTITLLHKDTFSTVLHWLQTHMR